MIAYESSRECMSVRGQREASAGGRQLQLFESARELAAKQERAWTRIHSSMGLMHNYVIQCVRVRLGGIAKQVPPFFREYVFHFYILATNIPL